MPRGRKTQGANKPAMSVVEAGRKGGERVLAERGPEFFSKIGKKGGQRVRELINAGRRAEAS